MKPYRITFILGSASGPDFVHGVVIAETDTTVQFRFRYSPSDTPTLVANKNDEHALWTRGWLTWWWPPHRQTKKAMLAAAAMGTGRIGIHTSVAEKSHQRARELWDKLHGDVNKVFGDLERSLPKLTSSTVHRYKITYRRR